MLNRLLALWQRVNASYWFYPALFSLAAVALASTTVWLDQNGWADRLGRADWLHPARPESASTMLNVIAVSMIGVASTVFSITIAAVAYASGNYGPRLLNNFMEDRGNQLSLGTFIATFVYALIVLRAVRSADQPPIPGLVEDTTPFPGFVPQLSLLVAYLLMGLSTAVLVYFLNHIPASIRVNTVLEGIGERLLRDIKRNFPNPVKASVEYARTQGRAVRANLAGYVQRIDFERLDRIACKVGGTLKLALRSGDFVHHKVPLAYWTDDDAHDDLHDSEIRDCFVLGGMRTPQQDLQFLIDELVEIGMRALSPGINDPFTAITAIHWLGAATAELGRRDLHRRFGDAERPDDDRLILLDDDFEHYVFRGFGALRGSVATNRLTSLVAFDTLHKAALAVNDPERRQALREEGDKLFAQLGEHLVGPSLEEVEARYRLFVMKMEAA